MIRLFRANVYRFLCSYWNYVILAVMFVYGVYVAQYGDLFTPQKLQDRFSMDEYEVMFEIIQRNLNLYDATNFDEMMVILYHRQFYSVFYRVAGEAMPFISMVIPSLVLCTGFSTRGFRLDCQKTSRVKAILVRVILAHLVALVVCWLLLAYMLRAYTSWWDYSTSTILIWCLLASIESLAYNSLTCLVGVAVRQPVLSVIASFVVTITLVKYDLLPTIAGNWLGHILSEAPPTSETVANLISVLILFAICTALTVLAAFLSRKVDLK